MRALALAVLLALAGGCYSTYYHFDAPLSVESKKYTGQWRIILLAGLIEANDPVALDQACPGGQIAVIEEETSPAGAIVGALLNAIALEFPLVHFRGVKIWCSPPVGAPTPIAPRPQ